MHFSYVEQVLESHFVTTLMRKKADSSRGHCVELRTLPMSVAFLQVPLTSQRWDGARMDVSTLPQSKCVWL